jgi:hypothetical protein
MSLGTILLIILVIVLLGGGFGGGPFLRDRVLWWRRPRPRARYRADLGFARQALICHRTETQPYFVRALSVTTMVLGYQFFPQSHIAELDR